MAEEGKPEIPTRVGAAAEADAQTLSELEQTIADNDQTAADLDQTAADTDEHASRRDQLASDRDQAAADEDEAAGAFGQHAEAYSRSRRARSQGVIDRDRATQARTETARIRDAAAARRDRLADERDGAARARDELAAAQDAELERLESEIRRDNGDTPIGIEILLRAAGDRKRAAAARAQAAIQREAAARDRERAAEDRRLAARDRAAAAGELALEGADYLTGALRRRVGLAAIHRELDRTSRTGERLVVAFVDVDGLKAINDNHGHAAGDDRLRAVAQAIMQHLRSYDVIVRFGGDEFVCSLSGQDAAGAHDRFEQIATRLAKDADGATFTVGIAERGPQDTLEQMIKRADEAMIGGRQHEDYDVSDPRD